MAGSPASSSSSSASSSSDAEWTGNEGDSTDSGEEAPAAASQRGMAALVTASCPRRYPRDLAARRQVHKLIPADYQKEQFLKNFRTIFNRNATAKLELATCHDEPHKRFRPSADRRERHYHIAMKASGNFAHKKVADAFFQAYGVRISFSFKLMRFVGNLQYLLTPGKKPSTDLDMSPATYPPNLDLGKELKKAPHPKQTEEGKKRKRLTFDEVSNIVIEGIGDGPLHTGAALQDAARSLKRRGQVELWNYLGDHKSASETSAMVSRVWQLNGTMTHAMWRTAPEFPLSDFEYGDLQLVQEWVQGKWMTNTLVISGDGGLKKTSLAEALIHSVAQEGFWFVDDPDDLRELEGLLLPGHGIVVDEIELSAFSPNQVKKLFDVEKSRRVKCRHFNGSLPRGCPRIFCTNSDQDSFYPRMKSKEDRTGVLRRQLFQVVTRDLKKAPPPSPSNASPAGAAGSSHSPSFSAAKELAELSLLHRDGFLDADEFKAAKRQLLGLP